MFRFFTIKKWYLWSWVGSLIILSSLWVQVKIDVKINEWFGEFYDMIQKALGAPNAITIDEYWASLFSFITLAAMYVGVAVIVSYFTSHYLFRWRTAMVEYYHSVYEKARKIEGASQRVQEDTIKFSRIMESLGTSLIEAIMILVEFMPILFGLSIGIPIFFFGDWDYGLIVGALIWSVGGTIFLIVLGLILRLVGVEYDLQKKEAAYRKILVIAEDDGTIRPKTIEEYWSSLLSFIILAALYVGVAVLISFFTSHYLFRWRTAMVEWYHSVYDRARKIEGASQRVQEDTIKFSRIMESLGTSFIEAIMILVEFMPILFGLSIGIPIFFFGDWDYGLIVGALIWSVGGTIFLILLGLILRLVGVEYDLQKKEAAYRKILVIAEDDGTVRPKTIEELFDGVRSIHFLSYIRYLYFNIGRIAYLQANVLSAYVFLAPAIVAGAVTLGVMQQIIRAFGRVEGSMQYILKAWPTIIELASVYKRLREFESKINQEELIDEKV